MSALHTLRASCALPFEQARTMPPEVYTCEDFLALEQQHIFSREWLCVGRESTVPNTGDYLTAQIANQPVVVLRDTTNTLRAYSNVCLHRLSVLLEGVGHCEKIVCPYHGWHYNLQGQLLGGPQMKHSPAFKPCDYTLPELRIEVWQGWIYLTLNQHARPVAEQLATLEEKIRPYAVQHYTETFREEHVWHTNWKILAENFMESYHLPVLHKATVGGHSHIDDMDCPPGEPHYNIHWIKKEASLTIGNAHPDNRRLQGEWRQTTALIALYPSHLITLTPGYFWYLCLQPRGTGQVHMTFAGGLSPEFVDDPAAQQSIVALKTLLDEVNREDRRGTEAVFRGANAPLARPGHLCHLERPNYDFAQYLVKQLEHIT